MEKYRVGVIGGTGMVGQRFVTLLENHHRPHLPQGLQSLSHHSSAVRIPIAITRSATRLQMPHPANASAMAVRPPASDEAKSGITR